MALSADARHKQRVFQFPYKQRYGKYLQGKDYDYSCLKCDVYVSQRLFWGIVVKLENPRVILYLELPCF
jgi:hypothetical protein